MKTDYEVVTPLKLAAGEDVIPAGDTVSLDEKTARPLLTSHSIRLVPGAAKAAVKDPEVPLSDLTKPQLEQVAADEKVSLDGAKNNAERVARIEAVRLARTLFAAHGSLTGHLSPVQIETLPGALALTPDNGIDADALTALIEGALAPA